MSCIYLWVIIVAVRGHIRSVWKGPWKHWPIRILCLNVKCGPWYSMTVWLLIGQQNRHFSVHKTHTLVFFFNIWMWYWYYNQVENGVLVVTLLPKYWYFSWKYIFKFKINIELQDTLPYNNYFKQICPGLGPLFMVTTVLTQSWQSARYYWYINQYWIKPHMYKQNYALQMFSEATKKLDS